MEFSPTMTYMTREEPTPEPFEALLTAERVCAH